MERPRVFLLSPARCAGPRATMLAHGTGELSRKLQSQQGAPLGDVFAWLSALYFRGKLAYAARFARSDMSVPGALVITPGHGLCRPSTRIRTGDLETIGKIDVDAENEAFAAPFRRDARLLDGELPEAEVVLLGSIATPKYVAVLLEVFGARLSFPQEFVGRGDMSRGGLLLRAARSGEELQYVPVQSTARTGQRARRLSQLKR